MKKLRTQFSTLQRDGRSIVGAGCSSCTCCCCVATTVIFSLATSRYLYVKAGEYNASPETAKVVPIAFGAYGLLSYLLAIALMVGAANLTNLAGAAVVIGSLLSLVISGVIFHRIKLHPLLPVLLLAGYALVCFGEIFAWAGLGLIK